MQSRENDEAKKKRSKVQPRLMEIHHHIRLRPKPITYVYDYEFRVSLWKRMFFSLSQSNGRFGRCWLERQWMTRVRREMGESKCVAVNIDKVTHHAHHNFISWNQRSTLHSATNDVACASHYSFLWSKHKWKSSSQRVIGYTVSDHSMTHGIRHSLWNFIGCQLQIQ